MTPIAIADYLGRMRDGEIYWRWEWESFPFSVRLREWQWSSPLCRAATTGRTGTMNAPAFFVRLAIGRFRKWRRQRRLPKARIARRR